jgi:hypothetical protein
MGMSPMGVIKRTELPKEEFLWQDGDALSVVIFMTVKQVIPIMIYPQEWLLGICPKTLSVPNAVCPKTNLNVKAKKQISNTKKRQQPLFLLQVK